MAESRPTESNVMTVDEASMERSKSFVKALQELKNLRPQLFSAAEYCEKSFIHSEQKQVVLKNLKDYTVRALVNAVDHLGTVASKLTDLLDQQTLDVSTMQLKTSCLHQKLLTCRTYMDNEGSRQQHLLALIPRHHKHYVLPDSLSTKVHFIRRKKSDDGQNRYQAKSRLQPSDTPVSKTLSWHLASETKSTLKRPSKSEPSSESPKTRVQISGALSHLDNEECIKRKYFVSPDQLSGGVSASTVMMQTYGVTQPQNLEGFKFLTAFRPFDNRKNEIAHVHTPVRGKSMLSALFVKEKTPKLKAGYVS